MFARTSLKSKSILTVLCALAFGLAGQSAWANTIANPYAGKESVDLMDALDQAGTPAPTGSFDAPAYGIESEAALDAVDSFQAPDVSGVDSSIQERKALDSQITDTAASDLLDTVNGM